MSLKDLVTAAEELLESAVEKHRPDHIVAMFSGGHDSVAALHLAAAAAKISFACHIDTGTGIPATRSYVDHICKSIPVELRVYRALDYLRPDGTPDPQDYRTLVLERGFPGPAMHTKMYNRLKERPLRQMLRELKETRKERVLLVSGLRQGESARRTRHTQPTQVWEGTKMWVAPLWCFDKLNVNRYLESASLPRSPVVDRIHKSGECLCGAFAKPGEKAELRFWYPEVADRLEAIEAEVRARGFDWGWGERPPRSDRRQLTLFESVLCSSCVGIG